MQHTEIQLIGNTQGGTLFCPLGEQACTFITEMERLRAEVGALSALVRTDELTGLYNYRHFIHAMEVEMERTRRSRRPMSLIMLDLDHFKSFNDRWGHEFGNTLLVHVARILSGTIRRLDIACRYGGEEFAIILPDTTLTSAIMLANRLREKIASAVLLAGSCEVSVTVSFGVDVYTPEGKDDASQFLQRADSWLFQAKLQGRNRVCHPAPADEPGISQIEDEVLLDAR